MTNSYRFAALCCATALVLAAALAGCGTRQQTTASTPAPVTEPTATSEPTPSAEPTSASPVPAGDVATAGSWTLAVREVESNLKGTDDSGGSGPGSGGSGAGDGSSPGDDNPSGDDPGAGSATGDAARMKIEIMVTNNADETLGVKTADWTLLAGGDELKPADQKDASKMGARDIEAGGTEDVTVFFDTPNISGVYTLRFTPSEGGPGSVDITVP